MIIRFIQLLLVLGFTFSALGVGFAQEPSGAVENHQAGLRLYQEQRYIDAMAAFQKANQASADNVFTLYNWGLAAYKVDQKGLALGLWRRALHVDPGFAPALSALRYAQTNMPEQVFSTSGNFIEDLKTGLLRNLSLNGLLTVNILLLAFAGWLSLRYWGRLKRAYEDELPKPPFPWVCALFVGLFVASIGLIGLKALTLNEVRATVLENNLALRTAPSEEMNALFTILEGMEVIVTKASDDWRLITYPGGMSGWVPAKALFQHTGS